MLPHLDFHGPLTFKVQLPTYPTIMILVHVVDVESENKNPQHRSPQSKKCMNKKINRYMDKEEKKKKEEEKSLIIEEQIHKAGPKLMHSQKKRQGISTQ